MASSSEVDSDDLHSEILCYMCIKPPKTCPVQRFTDKTWPRFLDFVSRWKLLEGEPGEIQIEIARKYSAKNDSAEFGSNVSPDKPANGGHHQVCYSRFTDKQKIQRTIDNMNLQKNTGANAGKFY